MITAEPDSPRSTEIIKVTAETSLNAIQKSGSQETLNVLLKITSETSKP